MILRKFYAFIILRIVLISVNAFLIVLVFQYPKHLFSILISIAIFILQIVLLIRYLNKTNRNLANFFGSILYKDGTLHLPENESLGAKSELNSLLNVIGKDLKNSRIETEKQYFYLKNIIDHIDTGIVAFKPNGIIDLVNNATLNLFKLAKLETINELDQFHNNFSNILQDLLPGIPKLLNVTIANEEYFLSVRASVFKLEGSNIKLVSFHVINEEINEAEIKSWEKLIRVLTHEIMNSVSPISSLTTTITRIFKPDNKKKAIESLKESDIDDTISGLDIIYTRSRGLIDFINKYRKVHLMPNPVFEDFEILNVLSRIEKLFHTEIEKNNIDCKIEVYPKNLTINADKAMIEQVIINLFKNAIEAQVGQKEKSIVIKGFRDLSNNPIIEISDKGPGIPEKIKDDIFVPFFSTKDKGSGIGLSLAKQLVFLNKAKLNVKSEPGEGTSFTLIFNK